MDIVIKINKKGVFISRIVPVAILLFFAVAAVFCVFYLFTGYYHLIQWFNGLNDCYYRKASWTSNFFTGKTKAAGNIYCVIGLLASFVGGWYSVKMLSANLVRKNISPDDTILISVPAVDVVLASALILVATVSWFAATSLVYPSNDEVFSAVNCAELHPFQTLSYYMLPNNHILFNLINNLFFHFCSDKVVTGRIISLACYWGIVLVTFAWLKQLLHNRWLAFATVIALSLQFPVWGFAAQARGYELLTLAEWATFISLYHYLSSGRKRWLYMLALAGISGYFTVPSFLYFHVAVLLFASGYQVVSRKADFRFWKCQAAMMIIVFLLFLPAICFSGLASISGNQYVIAYQGNKAFFADALPMYFNYMDYCFFNFVTANHQADTILFLLPLCLFGFRKNRKAIYLGSFYVALWASVILLTLKMRIFPFDRTLAGQFSITLAMVVYTVYLLASGFAKKIKMPLLPWLATPLLLVGLSVNFMLKGRQHINHYLCHFPVNDWHGLMEAGIRQIPAGSSAAFSDESFYLYYLARKDGYKATQCSTASEDYFINLNEPFPPGIAENYGDFKRAGDYYIYIRKK